MSKLVSMKEMLHQAQKGHYAVPMFDIHNMETMQVIAQAAMELRSPLIIAATPSTVKYAGIDYMVALARVVAAKTDLPIALHMDHFTDVDFIKDCVRAGFTSAMIDASALPYEENVRITKEIVDFCHARDVTVEAELGRLVGIEDNISVDAENAAYTDPADAVRFVADTEVDCLAVAIGTAHGLYHGTPKLDFDRLVEIRKVVSVPLVMHGASDVPDEMVRKSVELGMCKVNVSTDLKIPFSTALKAYFKEHPDATDPRKYMPPAKEAMLAATKHKIEVFGSANKY